MAYVPGFSSDIFLSYAHADDRGWVEALAERLRESLCRLFGPDLSVWLDADDLRRSRDFRKEIPDEVKTSAVFLLLASPNYTRSDYCVNTEYEEFRKTIEAKRVRFNFDKFRNQLFAVRARLLPVDGNVHWKLFDGLTDISFHHDSSETFKIGSPQFDGAFRTLTDEVATVLRDMRNHSTPVFLYPNHPSASIKDAWSALTQELTAQTYRVLPDAQVGLDEQLKKSALTVFLLGDENDERIIDQVRKLAQVARASRKPWIVWHSQQEEASQDPNILGLHLFLDQMESPNKTNLTAASTIQKLKEEVLTVLRPQETVRAAPEGKPRVYVVFDRLITKDGANAGLIKQFFPELAHFDFSDDPLQHNLRLVGSDGVLLVWGHADEAWCSRELERMLTSAGKARSKGLCVFDPEEPKKTAVRLLRASPEKLHVAEQFGGRFDPRQMDTFFQDLQALTVESP